MSREADGPAAVPAGLCARCVHSRVVRSDRGSRFVLCELAAADARFARYPQLPVRTCAGFEPREKEGE